MLCYSKLQVAAAAALLSLQIACSVSAADATGDSARELEVTAADFHFRAPDTVPAGLTRIRLRNDGPEHHHVELVRLEDGHTMQELLDRMSAGEFALPWATFVGGPEAPPAGGESEVTLTLDAGQYAMICIISSSDRVRHVAKGMAHALTVTASSTAGQREPKADVRMVLDDYSFEITPGLRFGRRTIRVENAASQPHHVAVVRLAPGKSAADVLGWFKRREGPPPGEPIGGVTAIAPGLVNFVTAEFARGEYALFCFVPDAKDGRSHVAHGMVRQIRVE